MSMSAARVGRGSPAPENSRPAGAIMARHDLGRLGLSGDEINHEC
jgi:hypothetical protein